MEHVANAITGRTLDSMQRIGTTVECGMNEVIYKAHQPATCWYRVVDGAVREVAMLANGRRDIVDFLLPGDVFGFARADNHEYSAEAITPTTLERFACAEGEHMAQSDEITALGVESSGNTARDRLLARTALLAHSSAPAKVGGFLLQMLARSRDAADAVIDLPMSRSDIADHLGLSMETVCRALTTLRTQRLIVLDGTRRVRITEPLQLARLARIDSALVPQGRPDKVRNVCLALATKSGR